jgi:hypothetical protein
MRYAYVAAMRVAQKTNGQPTNSPAAIAEIKQTLFKGFQPTISEKEYMSGGKSIVANPHRVWEAQWALLCVRDPKFPVKILMSRSTTLDFEPSYQMFPDSDVVVYCPFHRQALLRDGKAEWR